MCTSHNFLGRWKDYWVEQSFARIADVDDYCMMSSSCHQLLSLGKRKIPKKKKDKLKNSLVTTEIHFFKNWVPFSVRTKPSQNPVSSLPILFTFTLLRFLPFSRRSQYVMHLVNVPICKESLLFVSKMSTALTDSFHRQLTQFRCHRSKALLKGFPGPKHTKNKKEKNNL